MGEETTQPIATQKARFSPMRELKALQVESRKPTLVSHQTLPRLMIVCTSATAYRLAFTASKSIIAESSLFQQRKDNLCRHNR